MAIPHHVLVFCIPIARKSWSRPVALHVCVYCRFGSFLYIYHIYFSICSLYYHICPVSDLCITIYVQYLFSVLPYMSGICPLYYHICLVYVLCITIFVWYLAIFFALQWNQCFKTTAIRDHMSYKSLLAGIYTYISIYLYSDKRPCLI